MTTPSHFGNSSDIRETCKRRIARGTENSWIFFANQSGSGNRSTGKTHHVHSAVEDTILFGLGDHRRHFEDNFDLLVEKQDENGKTTRIFVNGKSVDLCVAHKKTREIVMVMPCKQPLTNINKNARNYENSLIGESIRLNTHAGKTPRIVANVNITPSVDINWTAGRRSGRPFSKCQETKDFCTETGRLPKGHWHMSEEQTENLLSMRVVYDLDDKLLQTQTPEEFKKRIREFSRTRRPFVHNTNIERLKPLFESILCVMQRFS